MPQVLTTLPHTHQEPITESLHGVKVTDPYRWLENQDSDQTRTWIREQQAYARQYLDSIPGRVRIRERIREFLAVETYDTPKRVGNRYFYRRRSPEQEQPCIYMREGANGSEHLLVDPGARSTGDHTAVTLRDISPDGRLLLYEIKEGGERTGTFELLNVESRRALSDALPHGYLRGFSFTADSRGFYYVHEGTSRQRPMRRAIRHHVLGQPMDADREIFAAGDEEDLRLTFACTGNRMGILVYHFMDKTYTDFYLKLLDADSPAVRILNQAPYVFSPILLRDRILAVTDLDAPNLRVVEVQTLGDEQLRLTDVVPTSEVRIQNYLVTRQHLIVCYLRNSCLEVIIYDFHGNQVGTLPVEGDETVSLLNAFEDSDEILLAAQSFAQPSRLYRYTAPQAARTVWINSSVPFDGSGYIHRLVQYSSHDGTRIPIFLFGREDVVEGGLSPTIMTSYGGFGIPMTPQFSVFVAFMVERGCLFAVPSIRGGSDLGVEWHNSAKRQNRMTAYGDFLAAAEWLVSTGRSSPSRMAIFGGSNSGLLVGAAMTQRPDLFRAVVCMAPLLDMLRYHLFDDARFWKDEFGTADREDDFAVLSKYSPYHQVRDGIHYPATLIVSGDADRSCNPLHARKMTARLQAANASPYPVLLAYDALRGHSPVLPLTERVAGLTDRMAFLCDQLQLSA